MEIFLKLHGIRQLTDDQVSVDLEAVVLDGSQTLPGQAVALSMNRKTHYLATLADGRFRMQLSFPLEPGVMQRLDARCGDADATIDILPPGAVVCPGDPRAINPGDVLSGNRAVLRGEELTLANGYYEVTADIQVERGGKLIIEAGTTLEFATEAGIMCQGVLEAQGSPEARITFTARDTHWRNIVLYGRHCSGTLMRHCIVEHGAGRVLKRDSQRKVFEAVTDDCGTGPHHGGGLQVLYTQKAEIALDDLIIRENTAKNGNGGGLYLLDAAPVMKRCQIMENETSHGGGGIYVGGAASVHARFSHVEINDNKSLEDGGGIYLDGVSPSVSDTQIMDNEARFGGAVYHNELAPEHVRLSNCKMVGNISLSVPDDSIGVSGSW